MNIVSLTPPNDSLLASILATTTELMPGDGYVRAAHS